MTTKEAVLGLGQQFAQLAFHLVVQVHDFLLVGHDILEEHIPGMAPVLAHLVDGVGHVQSRVDDGHFVFLKVNAQHPHSFSLSVCIVSRQLGVHVFVGG